MSLACDTPGVSELELAAFERRAGRSVPASYRSFLIEHNGGRIAPASFSFTDADGPNDSTVHTLLGVTGDEFRSLERHLRVFGARIPSATFPFARDPMGNLLLIGADGGVLFWDHDGEIDPDDGEPDYRNVSRVADSFEAFVAALRD